MPEANMAHSSSGVAAKGFSDTGYQGLDARIQIKILQDDKLDLASRIAQMVSRSELLAARAEASARQGEVQVLEQQLLKQRESIDGLNERLRSVQEDNSRMHVIMQVGDQSSSACTVLAYVAIHQMHPNIA
jgi:hypothetical protein